MEPIRDPLGIETYSAANAEARKLTSCRHAVNVFVVHSKEFGQVGEQRYRLDFKEERKLRDGIERMYMLKPDQRTVI